MFQNIRLVITLAFLLTSCVNMRCVTQCGEIPPPKPVPKVGPTITEFTTSAPITPASGSVITGLHITSPSSPCIDLTNVNNVTIYNNIIGPCGDPLAASTGIQTTNSHHLTIKNNEFHDVTALDAESTTLGNIHFYNNFMTSTANAGMYFIMLMSLSGPNIKVKCNISDVGENFAQTIMHLSIWIANGTSLDPIEVAYNKFRGGADDSLNDPPYSGGIDMGMLGSYQSVHHNTFVNTGNFGVRASGGNHGVVSQNKVFGKQQTWDGYGLVTYPALDPSCTNYDFSENSVHFLNSVGVNTSFWDGDTGGGAKCLPVTGMASNHFDDLTLTSNVWDDPMDDACVDP